MVECIINNDNLVKALKILGRYLQRNQIIKDAKKIFHEKPSEVKIRKKKESKKRIKKARYNH